MRVSDIFDQQILTTDQIATLRTACSQFLEQSDGLPLYKPNLHPPVFSKVKVRNHNRTNTFIETFNQAFLEEHSIKNLHQRSIFASPVSQSGAENVYVFPKNGFKFLYNDQVPDANNQYKFVFEQLCGEFDSAIAEQTIKDLLKYTYESSDLNKGIKQNAEIILYDVPYYYAVGVRNFPVYTQLLKIL